MHPNGANGNLHDSLTKNKQDDTTVLDSTDPHSAAQDDLNSALSHEEEKNHHTGGATEAVSGKINDNDIQSILHHQFEVDDPKDIDEEAQDAASKGIKDYNP